MRTKRKNIKYLSITALISIITFNSPCFSQDKNLDEITKLKSELSGLKSSISELTNLVKSQQKQIEQLRAPTTTVVSNASSNLADTVPTITSPTTASSPKSSMPYLPDIGVIADIVGTSTQSGSDEEGNDRIAAREVEFVFSHDIDPFSFLNVVATFSDYEDPALEEANVTFLGLPGDIKARIGRMRQRIGKASATHRDALDTVDEPLVIQQYLGTEGLYKTGLELSTFTPLSSEKYTQELVMGFMEGGTGEDGDMFSQDLSQQTLYSHLANFLELSEDSSFELGGTFLTGADNENSNFGVKTFGLDATYQHYFNSVNKLKLLGESYFQSRNDNSIQNEDGGLSVSNSSPYGFYTLADYRLAERWATGVRYDYVQPSYQGDNISQNIEAYSGYLTFYQSEFARWRFEYQRYQAADENDDNRFFVQGTFAIGSHKHQLN